LATPNKPAGRRPCPAMERRCETQSES
jgi:hypothetical protein